MSRVSRSRPRLHNLSESDITINSADEDDQDEFVAESGANHVIDAVEDEGRYQHRGKDQPRIPLKSTLLTDQGPGSSARRYMKHSRNPIPDTLWERNRIQKSQNDNHISLNRKSLAGMDATLSTQRSDSLLDDFRHEEMMNRKDESMIEGVGQGHHRRTGGGRAVEEIKLGYNQHQFAHPSPGPAARYGQLRQPAMTSNLRDHDKHAESGDDSESVIESSSSSSEAANVQDLFHHAKQSIGGSTGNHQGFMRSPQISRNVENIARPKLPYRWKDRMGELHSPSDAIAGESRKRDIGTVQSSVRPPRSDSASNESGFAAGSNRKVSSGSSKGKEAEASTSGATLVNEQNYAAANASHFRLPSGQRMGKGVPSSGFSLPVDLTGMSMALESPVKTRQGVEHRAIIPETVQAFAATTLQERERELNGLASYIKHIEKKVDKVEDVSNDFANELGNLKSEWIVWKETQHGVKEKRVLQDRNDEVHHSTLKKEHVDGDETIHYRSKLANAHKLASDIGISMEDYRATLMELRQEEQDLLARESLRSKKSNRVDRHKEEKDDVDFHSLRSQVEAVSREVDRLKIIVDRQGKAREILSASSPIKPSSRSRTTKIGSGNPFVQQRKISEELKKQNTPVVQATYDDGFGQAPKQRLSSGQGSDRHIEENFVVEDVMPDLHGTHLDEVEDVSMVAEKRAERASEKVTEARSIAHDVETCTCCARQDENKRRKDARKMKALNQWRKEEAKSTRSRSHSAATYVNPPEDDFSAHALLEEAMLELENHVDSRLPPALIRLANKQRSLLERTIKEEMDEFYHAKRTYCDLADELKSFSPDISAANRRILADHVLVAVEGLELRANRIDRLRAALAIALPGNLLDELDGQNDQFDNSLQNRSRKHHTKPRNSPPIVDKALYSHQTDAFRRLNV